MMHVQIRSYSVVMVQSIDDLLLQRPWRRPTISQSSLRCLLVCYKNASSPGDRVEVLECRFERNGFFVCSELDRSHPHAKRSQSRRG